MLLFLTHHLAQVSCRFGTIEVIVSFCIVLYCMRHCFVFVVSSYLSVYASMQFVGIFLAPLSGRLMDRKSSDDAPPAIKKIGMYSKGRPTHLHALTKIYSFVS